mmetsp:Transcript_25406/g.82167  ORF Transcript_25406/g.82167 Transcript_25406/m.82167 type:complete len:496 (-) Transcript_25406:349-1836(-)
MQKYGRSWTKISQVMMTRSEPQVRSHAQKHFLRVSRLEKQAAAEGKQALEEGKQEISQTGATRKSNSAGELSSNGEGYFCASVHSGGDDTAQIDRADKQKRTKRRRVAMSGYGTLAPNLGMLSAVPDAAALVSMAAQAAAVKGPPHIPDVDSASRNAVAPQSGSGTSGHIPSSLIQQTLTVQQHRQLPHLTQQDGVTPAPAAFPCKTHPQPPDNPEYQSALALQGTGSYAGTALQAIQPSYTLQQLHQASMGLHHLQQAQVMAQGNYFNYMPLAMRADVAVTNPSWNSMAVASTLGMVGSPSPWILPMTQVATAAIQPSVSGFAYVANAGMQEQGPPLSTATQSSECGVAVSLGMQSASLPFQSESSLNAGDTLQQDVQRRSVPCRLPTALEGGELSDYDGHLEQGLSKSGIINSASSNLRAGATSLDNTQERRLTNHIGRTSTKVRCETSASGVVLSTPRVGCEPSEQARGCEPTGNATDADSRAPCNRSSVEP